MKTVAVLTLIAMHGEVMAQDVAESKNAASVIVSSCLAYVNAPLEEPDNRITSSTISIVVKTKLIFGAERITVIEDIKTAWNRPEMTASKVEFEEVATSSAPYRSLTYPVVTDGNKYTLTCATPNCWSFSKVDRMTAGMTNGKYWQQTVPFGKAKVSNASIKQLSTCNRETAQRIARALSDVMKLSGGKSLKY